MSKASIEMHLTLSGPRADVSALLLMAAEQGLLKAMDVVESSDNGVKAPPGKAASLSRPFNPGARVRVRWDSAYYGIKAGQNGAVVTSVKYKGGYRVTVRWDGGGESTVGSSSLQAR